ncbi:MAG: twin-arginine translocase subunit TatC [Verrucomicrobiota bacterium]|nr:twin-arginine translocase subunit TatC [Verrucomicrobiota bacterium]
MSSPKDQRPASFGDRFREEGLSGILKKKPKDPKADPNEMHFLEHLEELRWVILKSVVAFLLGCIGVAIFMQDSVKLLQIPLIKAVEDFGEIGIDLQSIGLEQYTNPLEKKEVGLGELRKAREQDLINWGITDPHHQNRIINHFANGSNRNLLQVIRSYSPIFIAMKICFLGGIGLSLPMILYFVGSFVVPGLTTQEKKVFFPGCVAATFLFLAGASMTYFFILPLSLAFTIEFSFNVLGLDVYRPEAGNYYSTVIWMTFAVGIAFQFPLVLILLIRIGILSVKKLRESRRLVLVILMVSAALITPGGDPVSLCILTIPLYVLYEFAILFGSFIERSKAMRAWNDWDESIQGTRPEKPKTDKISLLLLTLIILAAGVAGIFIWKFQDAIKNSLDWFDSEKSDPTIDSIDSNQSVSSAIRETKVLLDDNRTLVIELLPMNDANLSFPQKGLYRAKIINLEE